MSEKFLDEGAFFLTLAFIGGVALLLILGAVVTILWALSHED